MCTASYFFEVGGVTEQFSDSIKVKGNIQYNLFLHLDHVIPIHCNQYNFYFKNEYTHTYKQ